MSNVKQYPAEVAPRQPQTNVQIIEDDGLQFVVNGIPLITFIHATLEVTSAGIVIYQEDKQIAHLESGENGTWKMRITGVELTPNV